MSIWSRLFNAKVKIGGLLWIGNVEVHERSSDWYRHHHETDAAYNNVILHVVTTIDDTVYTADGKCLPQLALAVPIRLQQNYQALIDEETYPPCYRIIPQVPDLTVHAWMSRLTVERLEEKTERVQQYLKRVDDDWERAFSSRWRATLVLAPMRRPLNNGPLPSIRSK